MKEKNYLIVDDYMVYKVLDKIKEIIDIEKFDYSKILIYTDYKFPDGVTLKKDVILLTCVIKYGNEFYSQLLLDHVLYDE